MSKLVGTWNLTSSENFDSYMQSIGVPYAERRAANILRVTIIILHEPDTDEWEIKTYDFKNNRIRFQLGKEFEEVTLFGQHVRTYFTKESENKLIQTQTGDKLITTTYESPDLNTLLMCAKSDSAFSKRTFRRKE